MTARHAATNANFFSTDISVLPSKHTQPNTLKNRQVPNQQTVTLAGRSRLALETKKPEAASTASGFLDCWSSCPSCLEIHGHVEAHEPRVEDLRGVPIRRSVSVVLLERRPCVRVEQVQDVDSDIRAVVAEID